jgi:hypothetical protein
VRWIQTLAPCITIEYFATGPLEPDTINFIKTVLGKIPLGGTTLEGLNRTNISSPSFGNIKFHFWKLVTLPLGEYCFQI